MTAINPEFAIIHLLIFDHPDGRADESFGTWNARKIRARLRNNFRNEDDMFTLDKVKRMVSKLQRKGLFDGDLVPLTSKLIYYAYDRKGNLMMKEVYERCRALHPEANLEWGVGRLGYDLEEKGHV